MPSLGIEVHGTRRIVERHAGYVRRGSDWRKPFERWERRWYRHIRSVFETEGTAAGRRWKPLTAET
jgi:hypothetical protein